MPQFTNIYSTLKGLDAANTSAIVAAAAQSMAWDAGGLARFCALIGASPAEVAGIIANARAAIGTSSPWFVQP